MHTYFLHTVMTESKKERRVVSLQMKHCIHFQLNSSDKLSGHERDVMKIFLFYCTRAVKS